MTKSELIQMIEWLEERDLDALLEAGLIERGGELEFEECDIARVQLIGELRRDLEVNDEALPIVLDLVDQVHELRRRVRLLGHGIAGESHEVRVRIRARIDGSDGRGED